MPRPQKKPLRPLLEGEENELKRLSRSSSAPAAQVVRARALLAVAAGHNYVETARLCGHISGDTVAGWVERFNREGLEATIPRHGGGPPVRYDEKERAQIIALAKRRPEPDQDGTLVWSLNTLRRGLARRGLPAPSTHTLWKILRESGVEWVDSRKAGAQPSRPILTYRPPKADHIRKAPQKIFLGSPGLSD